MTLDASGHTESAAETLSVVIKAYNEEAKIARALESALAVAAEVAPMRLEVILADSCSEDGTIATAVKYPVRIVQFAEPQERCCGAGVQLGYQAARGEFVYLMDGDMALAPGFLPKALQVLREDPAVGGVGGAVVDERVANAFDRIRVNNKAVSSAGPQKCLGGGGLYRRSAIDAAGGYAADPGLRGYEEAELGLRLLNAGYKLVRLPDVAVCHLGHDASTLQLFVRHWRSRRAMSAGVLLKSSWGRGWFAGALRINIHAIATMLWWLLLPISTLTAWLAGGSPAQVGLGWLCASVLGVGALAWRKGDVEHVMASVISWHYVAAAIVLGLLEPHRDPTRPIRSVVVQDPNVPPR